MKCLITSAASIALLTGTSSAQLGSVTSDTTGQLGTSVGEGIDLQTTVDTSATSVFDADTVPVESTLATSLEGSLETYELENASDRLGNQLRDRAEMMREETNQGVVEARNEGWQATRINTRVEPVPTPVTVYTRDGAEVGTVDRMDNGMIYVRGNGEADAETMQVSGDSAAFYADANAVVLDTNEAEFRANVEASAGSR